MPVLAPLGTIALPEPLVVNISASTVGLPLESRIYLAMIFLIFKCITSIKILYWLIYILFFLYPRRLNFLQFLQKYVIVLVVVLILQFLPGIMYELQCLQNCLFIKLGNLTLFFIAIFLAKITYLFDISGSCLNIICASLNKDSIVLRAIIFLTLDFLLYLRFIYVNTSLGYKKFFIISEIPVQNDKIPKIFF